MSVSLPDMKRESLTVVPSQDVLNTLHSTKTEFTSLTSTRGFLLSQKGPVTMWSDIKEIYLDGRESFY